MYTTTEIAAAEGLTTGYVQQIMGSLQMAGLVVSYRGKQGGFKLARHPHLITVADALRVTEGDIRLAPGQDGENCDQARACVTRLVWVDAGALLESFFQQTTIAELVERARRMATDNQDSQLQLESMPSTGREKGVKACSS